MIDTEIFLHPAFVILLAIAWGATALGWLWSRKQGWEALPIWQFLLILAGEFIAVSFFVAREA